MKNTCTAILALSESVHTTKEIARRLGYHMDADRNVLRQVKECNGKMESNPKDRSLAAALMPTNIPKVREFLRKNSMRTNTDNANSQSMFKMFSSRLIDVAGLKNLKSL